jgi:hypothetical protein
VSIDTLWDGCPSRSFNIKAHFMKGGVALEGRRISQSGQGLISKQYFDQLFVEGKLGTNSFQTLNWPYWVDQRSIEKFVDVD